MFLQPCPPSVVQGSDLPRTRILQSDVEWNSSASAPWFDQVQRKTIRMVDDLSLTFSLKLLAHRWMVVLLFFLSILLCFFLWDLLHQFLYLWSSSTYPVLGLLAILSKFISEIMTFLSFVVSNPHKWQAVEHRALCFSTHLESLAKSRVDKLVLMCMFAIILTYFMPSDYGVYVLHCQSL